MEIMDQQRDKQTSKLEERMVAGRKEEGRESMQ